MAPVIVNERPKWRPAPAREPLPFGYLYVAAAVDPPAQPGPPFTRSSPRRQVLLGRLKELAGDLARLDGVDRATVFRAVLVPSDPGEHAVAPVSHPARFDVAILIETPSPDDLADLQSSSACVALLEALHEQTQDVLVMPARCGRVVADVDKSRPGLYLFNHFTAEDPDVALQLWDWLAGWYAAETGLDNSTLLRPIGEGDYAFVNHARWDRGLPRLMLEQFARPSFRSFVLKNLRANHTVSMPVLCRRA